MALEFQPGARRLRILVVEDDGVVGMLLAQILEDLGHDVCGIEPTEDAAVAAALRQRPDLMIVDAQLAEGTGILVMARIIAQSGPRPHIFTSGSRRQLAQRAPSDAAWLEKPYFQKDLERAIARALQAGPAGVHAVAATGAAAADATPADLPGGAGASQ